MVPLLAIVIICVAHFVADFPMQARWMAVNKGSSIAALAIHIAQYSLTMAAICWTLFIWFGLYIPEGSFALWIACNAALHLVVDFISSRITKWAHQNKQDKLFWTTIGADQLAHQVCLFTTYVLLQM